MKIYIIGSIKIDSRWRKKLFLYSLNSLESISSLFVWNFNIVGKYADFARTEIMKRYNQVNITLDDESSYYQLIKSQIFAVNSQDSGTLFFFWMEDHWFICSHKNLFFYLLDEFQRSEAEILRVTHLIDSRERKSVHKLITDKRLYQEYLVNLDSQMELWKKWPRSCLTTMPGIYKKSIINELLEANKSVTDDSKHPSGYELHDQEAREFLSKRSFIEMIPTFHVFREVFRFNNQQRATDIKKALQIIRLRENQERLQHFGIWIKIVNMILAPRVTGGRIKRRIKQSFKELKL